MLPQVPERIFLYYYYRRCEGNYAGELVIQHIGEYLKTMGDKKGHETEVPMHLNNRDLCVWRPFLSPTVSGFSLIDYNPISYQAEPDIMLCIETVFRICVRSHMLGNAESKNLYNNPREAFYY